MTPNSAQELRMNLSPARVLFKGIPPLPLPQPSSIPSALNQIHNLLRGKLTHGHPPEPRLNGPSSFRLGKQDRTDLGDVVVKEFGLAGLAGGLGLGGGGYNFGSEESFQFGFCVEGLALH